MELTAKQLEGLEIAVRRYKERKKYTCIAGYAGTGKSTLISFIIDALGVDKDNEVCYVAFTGKAATVLRAKGCANACTAHRLLYHARPKADGSGFIFIKKSKEDFKHLKVIVVDEVSMLPKEMWELLLSRGVYVLATGDPGQLPPIDPDTDNHVLDEPHVFLDEIMRQAQDSEIIRLSMWVREGKPIAEFPCKNEQVMIIDKKDLNTGMYLWPDQILCAKNATRNDINRTVRAIKGYGSEPCIGDKIIGLTNHWDFPSACGAWDLTNGTIGTIQFMEKKPVYPPYWIYNGPVDYLYTTMGIDGCEDDWFFNIPIDYKFLTTSVSAFTKKQEAQLRKRNMSAPYDFSYAYAITTHKAQGSEWNKVLVFEESWPTGEDHIRWLYTAVTRAKEKVVIVRK